MRLSPYRFFKLAHFLFSYFTSLVDAYMKILYPSADQQRKIAERRDSNHVLTFAVQRWHYQRYEEEKKREENNASESDKLAFQAIDWNDFAVVEVIDFGEDELLDLPGLASLNLDQNNKKKPAPPAKTPTPSATSTKSNLPPPPPPPPAPTTTVASTVEMSIDDDDETIKIVSNYQPRIAMSGQSSSGSSSTATTMIDPISGKAIELDKLEEHMRIQLLDPRWREEQKRFQEKQRETGLAEGASIADNLKRIAMKRGDIFGQAALGTGQDSAVMIAKKEEEEKKLHEQLSNVQWDGYKASVNTVQQMKDMNPVMNTSAHISPTAMATAAIYPTLPVTASTPATTGSMSNLNSNTLVSYPPVPPMHLPPAPQTMMTTMGMMTIPAMTTNIPTMLAPPLPPPMYPPQPPIPMSYYPEDGNKAAKKQKLDANELLPAEEFLKIYPNEYHISIVVPVDTSSAHWNFNGQTIQLLVTAVKTVKDIKEELSSHHLGNIPTGKLQLKSVLHGFLKDTNSLASLNIGENITLEASVKSRGGKK